MVEFQFESDLSVEQREFIANVVKERGFENDKIKVQPVGKAGDNFMANVKRVTVESNSKTFTMIVKVAPKQDLMRVMGNTAFMFQNEHIMYTKVLPKYTELEKAANIPEEDRLKYAACYGTYMEEPNEIILLEDLEVPGFKMLDKFTSLTDENVRLVLKNFASLHSLAYVLKYQEPETFDNFSKSLVDQASLMANMPELATMFAQIDDDIQKILHGDKYKKAAKNLVANSVKAAKIFNASKFSVIQQGDSWTNNIMFKLENDMAECCMIDYQISKLSSPVADLHFMIFMCTDYATRTKHYMDWIHYYHTQLDKNLSNYGLRVNYVYPRDQLDADLRRFAKICLSQIIIVSIFTIRETENAAKLQGVMKNVDTSMGEMVDNIKLTGSGSATVKAFQTKFAGIIDSFANLGYL